VKDPTGAVYRTLACDRGDEGSRLDRVVLRHLAGAPRLTRTRVQRWIAEGRVAVNGSPQRKPAARVGAGDAIAIAWPDDTPLDRPGPAAEEAPLRVLFEDEHLLAVDKPAGMVAHPTYGHAAGTLMNALVGRARAWPDGTRPSLVGRLDKLTSGVVLVAKSAAVHAALQRELASARSEKDYLALVYGRLPARGRIDLRLRRDPTNRRRVLASPHTGSPSLTEFERRQSAAGPGLRVSLVRCRLRTGRMHQIRAHLAAKGWPIVGDPIYGEPRWADVVDGEIAERLRAFPRQALHAARLTFRHPVTGQRVIVEAPVPDDMQALVSALWRRT
jgi:23S rRNA pseudouridine1911/1915/1917 synthase